MDRSLAEGVWALMESSRFRFVSLDEIEMNGLSVDLAVSYLETLIKNDYVTMIARTAPVTGESELRFLLKNLTGPMAPYIADNGSFIDPNLQRNGKQRRAGRGGKPKDQTEPTPSARIVAMARQLKTFTRAEILEATGLAGQNDHSSAYLRGLSNRGWLYRLDRNEWQLAGTPQVAEIVENVLKQAAGGDRVDMTAAHLKWGAQIPQRTIGFVVHVMQAEGWKIETYPPSGKIGRTTYQVEAR